MIIHEYMGLWRIRYFRSFSSRLLSGLRGKFCSDTSSQNLNRKNTLSAIFIQDFMALIIRDFRKF